MVVRVIEHPAPPPPRRRRRRRAWLGGAVAIVVVVALAAAAAVAWSGATLSTDPVALARVSLEPLAGTLVSATARGPDGRAIPLRRAGGRLTPLVALTPGEVVSIDVVVRRPGWLGWALGSRRVEHLRVRAPVARVRARWLTVIAGAPVRVSFAQPVSAVSYAIPGQDPVALSLSGPARAVTLAGLGGAGSAQVSAAVRPWEKPGAPLRVSWFPPSGSPVLLASPAAGASLSATGSITLVFSRPVAAVLGSALPAVSPRTPGSWRETDAHTLVFTPSGVGFALGSPVTVVLPRAVSAVEPSGSLAAASTQLEWTVPLGSTLRLQQLLAQLGYLPVSWRPAGAPVARTAQAQAAAALAPPAGSFSWRYRHTPATLEALWRSGRSGAITRGAVMRFELMHGLAVDGLAGPLVWHALLRDAVTDHRYTVPYSYVYVHSQIPQKLTLWSGGRTILTSPGNTGIASRPTQPGTFEVFEHIPVGTMRGTNPDGTHYDDPGIRWISYFNGGDALHAFPRPSYGTPQSLGCVELPLAAAAKVWPYTPVGTLVTIEKS